MQTTLFSYKRRLCSTKFLTISRAFQYPTLKKTQPIFLFPNTTSFSTLGSNTGIPSYSTHFLDSAHYSKLIRICTLRNSTSGLETLQTHVTKTGFGSSNKLVLGFIKLGSIDHALKLFDEMPVKDIVTWNSMISYYIKLKRYEEAIRVYDLMVIEGVLPDEFTFSNIFKAFSDLGLVLLGRRAHGFSVVLGLEVSDVFVGSALVDMYAKFGNMSDARLVSNRVVEKDVVLFTALIVGYSRCGGDGEALEVFKDMTREGVKANEYTFASILISCGNMEDIYMGKLIHGLMIKMGLGYAVASQTSLVTMYSKCGLVYDSLKAFKYILNPNQVTWTSLVVGLVQNGREEIALTKFRKMMRSSISPNSFTLSSVLRACSSLAVLEQGRQIHATVMKYGLGRDTYTGSALIDLYGKCGSVDMARTVFHNLVDVDLVPTNSMIHSFAQNGFGHEALLLYNKMEELGLEPNNVTIVSVLSACRNAGLVAEGCKIFASAEDNDRITLTRDHYACMVDLLGRAGRLKEAEVLIKRVQNPDIVLWRALLNACKIHGEVDMAKKVMKLVLELAPGDDGVRVLLSNLYASTGNWNQVIEMRTMMRDTRVKKSPAMSWVDVDREVHTFVASDCSHPDSVYIYKMLGELYEKVKGLGYVPDTRCVLQDVSEKEKERSLYSHSEKIAVAFAILRSRNKGFVIRIFKNLRVCRDCHNWIKCVSKAVGREIIARDAKRFHHFRDGFCSCGDYW